MQLPCTIFLIALISFSNVNDCFSFAEYECEKLENVTDGENEVKEVKESEKTDAEDSSLFPLIHFSQASKMVSQLNSIPFQINSLLYFKIPTPPPDIL